MNIRPDIAERLRAGTPQAYIVRELRVSPITVQRTREALGLPAPKSGPPQAATLEEAFSGHLLTVDGGHVQWLGAFNGSTPSLTYKKQVHSVYRLAFTFRYGRQPVGKVWPACGVKACVSGDHVEDEPMRKQTRATFEAIFGGVS
ncbi:hypothetical protein ACFXKC_18105 [Streptomyces sp. NPDC059340]|uniref:hypothetical protein n=1 Tax=Streptomyces sp. NPDC059340 TaxID=3346806 RepID=UPI003697B378